MRISLYILRAHLGPFIFGVFTVMFVFTLQYLMNYLPQLVGKGLGAWVIIQLMTLNLSWMVVLAIPMGVLISTLMAFGNLSGSNEIVIIKSAGVSVYRMILPVFIMGILLSLWLFWYNDRVLPETNFRAQMLMVDIQRKKPTFIVEEGQFSTQIEGYSILSRRIDTSAGLMLGVTIYDNTKHDRLNVVSADSGQIKFSTDFTKIILMLYSGEIHQLNQQNLGDYRKIRFTSHRIIMDASGFAFSRSDEKNFSRGDRTMNIRDMSAIVTRCDSIIALADNRMDKQTEKHTNYTLGAFDSALTAEVKQQNAMYALIPEQKTFVNDGNAILPDSMKTVKTTTASASILSRHEAAWRVESRLSGIRASVDNELYVMNDRQLEANRYLVEIWKKISIPVSCIAFVLIGCPLGIITRRGNLGISGGLTLVFYVIYWAFLIAGEKTADRGLMPPWLAMWLADIVIGSFGIILMIAVTRENSFVVINRFMYNLNLRLPLVFERLNTLAARFRKKTTPAETSENENTIENL